MFNFFNRIKILETKINRLQKPMVGEVYGKYDPTLSCWSRLYSEYKNNFYQFKQLDVMDEIGDKIKIGKYWFDKKDVFLYDDIYNKQRESIKKRFQNDK